MASPLLQTSFTLFRLSPLHHGDQDLLNPTPLRIHACRLRDILRGEKLRGVHVGDDVGSNATTGRLEDCTWDLLDTDSLWGDGDPPSKKQKTGSQSNGTSDRRHDRRLIASEDACGIHIQLRYERVSHTALLLRNLPAPTEAGFTSFPLLLVRIPQPVRQSVLDYLSRTFDTHITPLQLSNDFLTQSLERVLRSVAEATEEGELVEPLIRSVGLSLSIPVAAPQLRSLEVSINASDVPKFLSRGKQESRSMPFTTAFSSYLGDQLALNQPAISTAPKKDPPPFQLVKVACSLLALAKEGKMKLTPPVSDLKSRRTADLGDQARETAAEALRETIEALIDAADGRDPRLEDA